MDKTVTILGGGESGLGAAILASKNEDLTLESVLEDWIADRKLSKRKIAFLKQVHQMNLYGDGLPSICPLSLIHI